VVKYNLLVIFIHHCMNDLLLYFILPAALHVRCQEQLIVVTQLSRLVNFNQLYADNRSRVSSGSIVSDYGLDDRVIGVRSPAGAEDFSYSLCVQTGSGAHPASCTMGTGGPFPGGKSAAGA
jgi:hypothetical protein